MISFGEDGKAYVNVSSPLISGWKEADSLNELLCYVPQSSKAGPPSPAAWTGASVPASVVGPVLGLIRRSQGRFAA